MPLPTPIPDLRQCEAEPIHLAGSIQPHGVLLALAEPSLRITQATTTCLRWLGVAAPDLLEHDVATALGPALAEAVRAALVRYTELPDAPASFLWRSPASALEFTGYVHRSEEQVVLELEPEVASDATRAPIAALPWVAQASRRMRARADVAGKAQSAAESFRLLSGYDRVMIYRFHEDAHGEVLAEACGADVEPYVGLHYPASDIPAQARRLFLVCPTREIVDVDHEPSPLVPAMNPVTGRPLDVSRSVLRSPSLVHLTYLRNMGVGASLTASLVCEGKLWGLITCHHRSGHLVSRETRELAHWLALDLAAQIALSEEQGARRYATDLKRHCDDLLASMRGGARLSALVSGPGLGDLLGAMGAEGVALIRGKEIASGGVTPEPGRILEIVERLLPLRTDARVDLFATDCLSEYLPDMASVAATAAGVAMVSLPAQALTLVWFRGEQARSVTWAGDPDKAASVTPDGRIDPRRSFQAWKQSVRLRSRPWRAEEVESARELRATIEVELRRTADEALARERERYLTFMKVSRDGIHLLDMQGRLVEANDAFLSMIGRAREDVPRLNVRDWDSAMPEEEIERELRANAAKDGLVFETRHDRPDGRKLDVEISLTGVELDGAKFILASSRDISARKELEQQLIAKQDQLEQLNHSLVERVDRAVAEIRSKDQLLINQGRQAAMGEMIENIAHQWRQPLNALSLVLANLRDAARAGELDAPAIEQAVADSHRLIQTMSSTINDFRDFFTPEKKKSVFSARTAVLQTIALIDASYRHAGIEVALEETGDVSLLGFANEYSHIVLNLLSNAKQAIQATKVARGQVTLRLDTRQGLGCLVLRDNGGGIPDAILDKIFDPYFSTKEGGSGIGLYMSRQIAEKSLGGRIEARNVEGGAEFTVLTPLAVPS
jgi:PAS domain S-box-containing protein